MSARDTFRDTLAAQYHELFATNPDYAYAASQKRPEELAEHMTAGLAKGSANKEGAGIRRTCKALGIAYTYKAIRAYLERP